MHYFLAVKTGIIHWKLWTYWSPTELLNTVPPSLWLWMPYFLALLALLLIGALLSLALRLPSTLNHRLGSLFWNNLWIGILLFFFRYQHVPILGMDIWRLVQEIAIVIWIFIIVISFRRNYPMEKLAKKVADYRSKYLPKPRK